MQRARELRKEPTAAESKLWVFLSKLKEEGIHFRRQHAIGPYIADFAAPSRKLIVEVDGGSHNDQEEYDTERTAFFMSKGYRVLRFRNNDVMKKLNDIKMVIMNELENFQG